MKKLSTQILSLLEKAQDAKRKKVDNFRLISYRCSVDFLLIKRGYDKVIEEKFPLFHGASPAFLWSFIKCLREENKRFVSMKGNHGWIFIEDFNAW